jgi:hypothetical protein
MSATYEVADQSVSDFTMRVMQRYHGGLFALDTTVDILMASPPRDGNSDPTGPALKLHGQRAYAIIRQTRPDERALGHADLHLKIDKEAWEEMDEDERTALIDHELSHITPKLKDGAVKRDVYERPLFCIVPHNYEVGWFFQVARRHGRKSIECRQLQDLINSDSYRDCMAASITPAPVTRRRMTHTGEI